MTDQRRLHDARQAILWSRVSRRRIEAAEAMTVAGDPSAALERHGEWLQGLQALHSSIAAVRSLMHRHAGLGAPLDPVALGDLHQRVGSIRREAAAGLKRIDDPWSPGLRCEGGALVAPNGGPAARISLVEWRHAIDAIEAWAQRSLHR